MSMCSTARIASRFSVMETGSPAARSSCTKPWRTSSIRAWKSPDAWSTPLRLPGRPAKALLRLLGDQLLASLGDVALVLQEHVQRLADHLRRDLLLSEVEHRARPVDRLRDRRGLLEVELTD